MKLQYAQDSKNSRFRPGNFSHCTDSLLPRAGGLCATVRYSIWLSTATLRECEFVRVGMVDLEHAEVEAIPDQSTELVTGKFYVILPA
jgi:hypothetical protein